MKTTNIIMIALMGIALCACQRRQDGTGVGRSPLVRGADISWLSEMEHDGVKWRGGTPTLTLPEEGGDKGEKASGESGDCLDIMQSLGMNAVRLRVWVNHSTGWSNKEDVVAVARRAAQRGLRVLIDFHYSDFFADPSHQTIPVAWENYDYTGLCEAVSSHTRDVLRALQEAGVEPEWVQIGNETPNGMLWPVGRVIDRSTPKDSSAAPIADNWDEYAGLTTAGYQAAKEVFPNVTAIVHVDNAFLYREWFFSEMEAHGGLYDMIGLSHYPMMSEWSHISWQEANRRAEENIRKLIATFHKPVMIAEIGMLNGEGRMVDGIWQAVGYDSIARLSNEVMTDFMARIEDIDSCAGVFYWEPQCYGGWRPAEYIPLGWGGYEMGAFTPEGTPSPALKTLFLPHED